MTTRVLLVEDEPSLAKAVARFLRRSGFDVVIASTCDEARVASGPFRAAILDIELPDGDGSTLASELIAQGMIQRTVFFTATRNPTHRAAAAQLGPICDKSDGVDKLAAALRDAVDRSRKKVAGGAPTASSFPPASGVRTNDSED